MAQREPRVFEDRQAVRESVPLLIGLEGPSGGGKTFSALRLGTGIQTVTGGEIYVIDTEAKRAKQYADYFKFRHIEFSAPFGSLDYLDAIKYCVGKGAGVVVVDSMSHEHEGPGGLLDFHEHELDRLAGNDFAKRERVKMLAWQKPKAARRQLINGLLQLNANFIFCFRAKETAKPMKVVEDGKEKTVVVPLGFMPIAGDEFIFEMTVNCLLLPAALGVPTWKSNNIGERQMMKLPEQFKTLFADSRALDETLGHDLAEWARGKIGGEGIKGGTDDFGETGFSEELIKYDNALTEAAEKGMDALKATWDDVPKKFRETLKSALDRRHKMRAASVDAEKKKAAEPAAA